jgi:hypothetical protein
MGCKPYDDPEKVRRDTFAMRVNVEERRMLETLARHLQRSQSDTVRLLVRGAMRELEQGSLLSTDAHAKSATRPRR